LHTPILDFEATAEGAEWIDAIAAKAKERAAGRGVPAPLTVAGAAVLVVAS
jgi:hypothetical protein